MAALWCCPTANQICQMFGCAGPAPTLQATAVEGDLERPDQVTEPVRDDKVGAVSALNLVVFPHISM